MKGKDRVPYAPSSAKMVTKKGFGRERKEVESRMNISWNFDAKQRTGEVKVELPCDTCCK